MMCAILRRLAAASSLSFLLILPAQSQTLTVAADGHVTDNVTDSIPNHYNFGGMNYLLVQSDLTRAYKTYLRFDLTPISQAGGTGVKSAVLSLTFSRFRDPQNPAIKEPDIITVYGITDNQDTWSEGALKGANHPTDLTFNNAPKNDKTSSTGLSDAGDANGAAARMLGTIGVPRDTSAMTEFRVDVSSFINWALRGGTYGAAPAGDADKTVTLVLVHTGGNAGVVNNGIHFFSKENTTGPAGENVPTAAPRLNYIIETTPTELKGVVSSVVDAETIIVRGVGNVRLVGVTALRDPKRKPQRDDELFGDDADRAARRLAAGQRVRLELEGEGKDAKGYTLAWVFLSDGSLLNEQLIRRGYARVGPLLGDTRHGERLRAAEVDARAGNRGLWPKQPPEKPEKTAN